MAELIKMKCFCSRSCLLGSWWLHLH